MRFVEPLKVPTGKNLVNMRATIYILIVLGIFALSFLYLYLHSLAVEFAITLDKKQRLLAEIDEELEKLRVSIASLISYSRIEEISAKMGYRYPDENDIVIIYEVDSNTVDSTSPDSI